MSEVAPSAEPVSERPPAAEPVPDRPPPAAPTAAIAPPGAPSSEAIAPPSPLRHESAITPPAAPTYEAACARIEDIIRRLDSGHAGLRETLELCQEGRWLVEFCAAELEAVGQGLEELRLDELVARLESGRTG